MEWWPIFWLFVVLKIPLLAALGIIWWAVRPVPEPAEGVSDDEDGDGPHGPWPRRPRHPRRGPHSGSPPASPSRTRARRRRLERAHR